MLTGACKQCHRLLVEKDAEKDVEQDFTGAVLCLQCREEHSPGRGRASEIDVETQTGSDLFALALGLSEIDGTQTDKTAVGRHPLGRWQLVVANAQRHDESKQD